MSDNTTDYHGEALDLFIDGAAHGADHVVSMRRHGTIIAFGIDNTVVWLGIDNAQLIADSLGAAAKLARAEACPGG